MIIRKRKKERDRFNCPKNQQVKKNRILLMRITPVGWVQIATGPRPPLSEKSNIWLMRPQVNDLSIKKLLNRCIKF
jgi:hypothetical protein